MALDKYIDRVSSLWKIYVFLSSRRHRDVFSDSLDKRRSENLGDGCYELRILLLAYLMFVTVFILVWKDFLPSLLACSVTLYSIDLLFVGFPGICTVWVGYINFIVAKSACLIVVYILNANQENSGRMSREMPV